MLVVSTFPNAKAAPLWAGRDLGFFLCCGLDLVIDQTPSSSRQRDDLAAGRVHIVQSAVDNALDLIAHGVDVVIVMGGESGMNDFIVQEDICGFGDFRGRTLAVDSPDTAYALQALEALAAHGLVARRDFEVAAIGNSARRFAALRASQEYGGAILNPPYSSMARDLGFRSLGRLVDLLGPYQAGGAYLLRSFAKLNPTAVESYIRAYVQSLRWVRAAENREAVLSILTRELGVTRETAASTYEDLTDPAFGFTPDAKLSHEGMSKVAATRRQIKGGPALDMGMVVDEFFYDRVMRGLEQE